MAEEDSVHLVYVAVKKTIQAAADRPDNAPNTKGDVPSVGYGGPGTM